MQDRNMLPSSREFTPEQKEIYNQVAKTATRRFYDNLRHLGPYAHWWDVLTYTERRQLEKIGW